MFAATLSFLRGDDETTSFAIGAALGSVAIGLLLAALFRFLWVRFGNGAEPVLDPPPWILLAGALALVAGMVTAANDAAESKDTLAEATEAVELGADTCPDLTPGPLGGGFLLATPSPRVVERLRSLSAEQSLAPAAIQEASEFLLVEGPGGSSSVLVVVPVDPGLIEQEGGAEQFAIDALNGLRDSVIDQGLAPESIEVAGEPAVSFETPAREFQTTAVSGCSLLSVVGINEQEVLMGLERVIDAAR